MAMAAEGSGTPENKGVVAFGAESPIAEPLLDLATTIFVRYEAECAIFELLGRWASLAEDAELVAVFDTFGHAHAERARWWAALQPFAGVMNPPVTPTASTQPRAAVAAIGDALEGTADLGRLAALSRVLLSRLTEVYRSVAVVTNVVSSRPVRDTAKLCAWSTAEELFETQELLHRRVVSVDSAVLAAEGALACERAALAAGGFGFR
jgi:hypothetical protein